MCSGSAVYGNSVISGKGKIGTTMTGGTLGSWTGWELDMPQRAPASADLRQGPQRRQLVQAPGDRGGELAKRRGGGRGRAPQGDGQTLVAAGARLGIQRQLGEHRAAG